VKVIGVLRFTGTAALWASSGVALVTQEELLHSEKYGYYRTGRRTVFHKGLRLRIVAFAACPSFTISGGGVPLCDKPNVAFYYFVARDTAKTRLLSALDSSARWLRRRATWKSLVSRLWSPKDWVWQAQQHFLSAPLRQRAAASGSN
jgi:hypothetical protein